MEDARRLATCETAFGTAQWVYCNASGGLTAGSVSVAGCARQIESIIINCDVTSRALLHSSLARRLDRYRPLLTAIALFSDRTLPSPTLSAPPPSAPRPPLAPPQPARIRKQKVDPSTLPPLDMATFTELQPSTTGELPAPSTSNNADATAPASTSASTLSAMTRLASFVPSIDSLKEQMGSIWARSRPWSEFANTAQMNKPQVSDTFDRVKENLEYYAFNYLVILLCLSALTVLTSPLAFLGGLFIVFAYVYLFFLNPEPLVVAGMSLDNNIKAVFILVFSLVMLWLTGAGATFTTLVVVVAIISLTHAAIRRPPGEADFDTVYTPATV